MPRSFYISLLLPLVIPPLVFLGCGLTSGMAPGELLTALIEQYSAEKHNLGMVALLGYVSIPLLLLILWLNRRFGGHEHIRHNMGSVGLTIVAFVIIYSNYEFWSRYLPTRKFLGFPHGLELVIGPAIFAPIAMVISMFVVWLWWRITDRENKNGAF